MTSDHTRRLVPGAICVCFVPREGRLIGRIEGPIPRKNAKLLGTKLSFVPALDDWRV
jgi:hypothetical protein